jgi:hypothetical protein
MWFPRRRAEWIGVVVAGMLVAVSELAWANGQEFFAAPLGKVDLVYTGRVRDSRGRFLKQALVVIWSDELGLTFPSVTDEYGHFRTTDVGEHVKELTAAPAVDLKQLKAACTRPGYKEVSIVLPKRDHGTIELNCTLRRAGTSAEENAAQADAVHTPKSGLFWLVPAVLVALVIGAAVRK